MDTEIKILIACTVINSILCVYAVFFKKEDTVTKEEFTEMSEEVKNNSNILRKSRA